MSAAIDDQARQLAREAARWLALQDAGELHGERLQQLHHWRARSAAHEALWQRAGQLRERFRQVPATVALSCLDRPDPQRRKVLSQLLVVGAGVPLAWFSYRQLPVERWRADVSTATGEQRRVSLADGSQLQLNTATAVDVAFEAGRWQVRLREGELAWDGQTPVRVELRQGLVETAAGRFCLRDDGETCTVTVSRGELLLRPTLGEPLRLSTGQRARMSLGGVTQVEPFDTAQPGWQQGVLIVDNQPLGPFLRELQRYRPGLLRWAPSLERLALTGTFALDDTDRILRLLAASLPVQVQYRTRYWVTLSPRTQAT